MEITTAAIRTPPQAATDTTIPRATEATVIRIPTVRPTTTTGRVMLVTPRLSNRGSSFKSSGKYGALHMKQLPATNVLDVNLSRHDLLGVAVAAKKKPELGSATPSRDQAVLPKHLVLCPDCT
ncbi:hypothetical protein LshimejAT787_0801520 [Lyophyllum shimeji]|uniref:Uncharacterized protein n=1 Tax=Lyophyllum shimeji TaxID=47721 RepID=A0A9P3PR88_LYOSH|nr:hypothetical protein LshimejAT787_0801520 [Lyophyllum shimeji]